MATAEEVILIKLCERGQLLERKKIGKTKTHTKQQTDGYYINYKYLLHYNSFI